MIAYLRGGPKDLEQIYINDQTHNSRHLRIAILEQPSAILLKDIDDYTFPKTGLYVRDNKPSFGKDKVYFWRWKK